MCQRRLSHKVVQVTFMLICYKAVLTTPERSAEK